MMHNIAAGFGVVLLSCCTIINNSSNGETELGNDYYPWNHIMFKYVHELYVFWCNIFVRLCICIAVYLIKHSKKSPSSIDFFQMFMARN